MKLFHFINFFLWICLSSCSSSSTTTLKNSNNINNNLKSITSESKGSSSLQNDDEDTVVMERVSPLSNITFPIGRPRTQLANVVARRDTDAWARGIVLSKFGRVGSSNIFNFTFIENLAFGKADGKIYRLPDHYICSVDKLGCDFRVQANTQTITSFTDIIHQTENSNRYGIDRNIQFEAEVKTGAISAKAKTTLITKCMFLNSKVSSDYASESMQETSGNVYGQMNQWSYECSPDFHKISLDVNFRNDVRELINGNSITKERVVQFVNRFGTHFYRNIMTGKLFYRSLYFSKNSNSDFKNKVVQESKSKDIDLLGLQYGSQDSSFYQHQQNQSFSSQITYTKFGCVGATDCDMQDSCQNNEEASSIVDYTLNRISSLFFRVVPDLNQSIVQQFDDFMKEHIKDIIYQTKPCLAVGCSGDDVCMGDGKCMKTTLEPVQKTFQECDPETYEMLVGNDPYSQLVLFHKRIQDICPRNVIWGKDGCKDWNVAHGMKNHKCWVNVPTTETAPMFKGVPNAILKCFVPNMYSYGSESNYSYYLEYYLWYGLYYQDSSWFAWQNDYNDLSECLKSVSWVENVKKYSYYTPEFQ